MLTHPRPALSSLAHASAGDDPALGCPVEYIDLRGTSYDNPAVCKYTGAGAGLTSRAEGKVGRDPQGADLGGGA